MNDQLHSWKRQDSAKLFLEDVRAGIPLAFEQIDVLLRVVRQAIPQVKQVLDLGCGDGILARAVLAEYPQAHAVFLDFSEYMIEAAKKLADVRRADFIVQDLASDNWLQSTSSHAPFDLVVSGFAIHHLTDERKRELYREIFEALKPGGLFLNMEHVSSASPSAQQAFDELFVDSLCMHHRQQGGTKTRETIAEQWYYRPDKTGNILAPVETQCEWLRQIGFASVDCFFKLFELALFGGQKPT